MQPYTVSIPMDDMSSVHYLTSMASVSISQPVAPVHLTCQFKHVRSFHSHAASAACVPTYTVPRV